jgi:spore maturation protein CgeB
MNIVIFGLSITSSWGNGHATTYRGLVRGLVERGHDVLFLERDVPWYASNRDLAEPPHGTTKLYGSLTELKDRFTRAVRDADLVIVGSYVPQGVQVGEWVLFTANGVTAFYDIDTPVTLARLERGDAEYLTRSLAMRYDLYFSFTGGPILERLRRKFRVQNPRALYCSVDPDAYYPEKLALKWDMGYLGTYSEDRQPTLDELMLKPARALTESRFVVAGPLYPAEIEWPANLERIDHIAPGDHRHFYNSQRFTLNVTRADMVRAGYSPSVRLFEAGACGTPIVSDYWAGLDELFAPGKEILICRSRDEAQRVLTTIPEDERIAIGQRLRARVLREHTYADRAERVEHAAHQLVERGRAVVHGGAARSV